jgi:predicted DCC family thiol-disulfide oxidoreductase YuxK
MAMPDADVEIEAFYDGDCSVCSREVAWIHRRDLDGRIRFIDIAAPGFDADRDAGIPIARLQDCIQARLASGEVIEGVEVFRNLYTIVGFPRMARLTRLPLLSPVLDFGYRLFAKNRLRLAGRRIARTCTSVQKEVK